MKCLLPLLLLASTALHAEERIISAGYGVTELIQSLGASSQLIAVDSTSQHIANRALPVVGYHRQLAGEGLIALRPTLLLGSDEMGPEAALQQVTRSGARVEKLSAAPDIPTLVANIDKVGKLTGRETQAQQQIQQVQRQVAKLTEQSRQLTTPPRLVYLLVVPGRPPMVAGSQTPADTLLKLAGAQNPADNLRNYPLLNVESLLAMRPDALVVSARSLKQDPQLLAHSLPQLAAHPELAKLPLLTIPGEALIGGLNLTTLTAAETLQQQLLKTEH